jgi:hyperosmotically inducible protein
MKKHSRSTVLIVLLATSLPAAGTILTGCGRSVTHTTRSAPDDGYITTRVKTAILNDPEITGRIDVDTVGGVVTLSGSVKTASERDKAIALARKVTGVSDVKSTLQVQ